MKQNRTALGILLLIEIGLLTLFAYGYYRWTIEWRLNGPTTTAEVRSKGTKTNGTNTAYFVTYEYVVDGVSYIRVHEVVQSYYEAVQPGKVIEVKYSPADVSVSGISGQGIGDYGIARLPGTFFDLKFLALVLPGLIIANFVLILVVLGRGSKAAP
jgi:hypothetical protein